MPRVLVEAVVWSVDDAIAAEQCGADRLELVCDIEQGGLTPSIGLLRGVLASCRLPVMAMVRPRSGGFRYSSSEVETMEEDARAFVSAGVHGIVFGALTSDGMIDGAICSRILSSAMGVEGVFHRAFDGCRDPRQALDDLIGLGFTRVLTSGCSANAIEGIGVIRRLREQATGRIGVLAGGGIRSNNVGAVVRKAGIDQVHLGPRRNAAGLDSHEVLDAEELRATVNAVRGL